MQRNLLVVLIAAGMSIIGNLMLESAGTGEILMAGPYGRGKYFAFIAAVSFIVWLSSYHLWIKRSPNAITIIVLAICVPFVGAILAANFWGLIAYFWFWWLFVLVSLMTACLLALVARWKSLSP